MSMARRLLAAASFAVYRTIDEMTASFRDVDEHPVDGDALASATADRGHRAVPRADRGLAH